MLKGSTIVFCARCAVQPEMPQDPKPDDLVYCPKCKRSDTFDVMLHDARRHATHEAKRKLEAKLTGNGHTVRNRTPTRIPLRNLNWITSQS